ncbi:MAG TPA: amidohydrolase family protein [Bryobacteraceae bacterium]|nr:amidohydrolase family protein [Bryobacteraceae bacterium]
MIRSYAAAFLLALTLCACKPAEEGHIKAIMGAVLIDGLGGPPLSDSVVVVAGDRISEAGSRSAVEIPDNADRIDGSGKFLVPAPLDVYPSAEAAKKSPDVQIFKVDPAALEAARDAGKRIVGHIATQADVRALVDGGAIGFVGMITDTEDLDPALLARLRNLRIFFAPGLVSQGAKLEIAERNTKRLFTAGVPIALASNGGDAGREPDLLAAAGIPPIDAIVAATLNSARALGESDQTGSIQAGKRADLLLLNANPGEDIGNLRKVALRMSGGNWVK